MNLWTDLLVNCFANPVIHVGTACALPIRLSRCDPWNRVDPQMLFHLSCLRPLKAHLKRSEGIWTR